MDVINFCYFSLELQLKVRVPSRQLLVNWYQEILIVVEYKEDMVVFLRVFFFYNV